MELYECKKRRSQENRSALINDALLFYLSIKLTTNEVERSLFSLRWKKKVRRGLTLTKRINVCYHDDNRATGRNTKDDVLELESNTYPHFKDLYRRMH